MVSSRVGYPAVMKATSAAVPLLRASAKAWTSRALPRSLALDMVACDECGGVVGLGAAKAVVCSGKRHSSSSNKQDMMMRKGFPVLGMHCGGYGG